MNEKNKSEEDTIVVACDFCESLFDMDRINYETAMEKHYDILCAKCTHEPERADVAVDDKVENRMPEHDEHKHEHKWMVVSTAVDDKCLMVECSCGACGTVDDPSKSEWAAAFYAPSASYQWAGGDERIHSRELDLAPKPE